MPLHVMPKCASRPMHTVRVYLHRGTFWASAWTCDLSHDHVSINADYRS